MMADCCGDPLSRPDPVCPQCGKPIEHPYAQTIKFLKDVNGNRDRRMDFCSRNCAITYFWGSKKEEANDHN